MPSLWQQLRTRLRAIEGVVEGESVFSPRTAFWVNGKEVGHPEDDGAFEVRLTRAVISRLRATLRADARVELRRSGADWITVRYESGADVAFVAALVEVAAAAHQPAAGVATKAPPTGADLERRRRFH